MCRNAEVVTIKVKSIVYAGKAPVYNMEVEKTHNFVVGGGFVAHNCYDEARYLFQMNPIPRREAEQKPVKAFSPYEKAGR